MITSRAETGSVHGTLEIDGTNTGALYLTSSELDTLTHIMDVGSVNTDREVSFKVEDSLDCNQVIDVDPWDD